MNACLKLLFGNKHTGNAIVLLLFDTDFLPTRMENFMKLKKLLVIEFPSKLFISYV